MRHRQVSLTFLLPLGLSLSCASPPTHDIARLYEEAAQNIGDERNPVVVIPGILGTKLEIPGSHRPVWGAFVYGAVDADRPEGARLIALPMEKGKPLSQLEDEVVATDVLDTLTLDIGLIRGLELGAYVDILSTLAAGKYRDQSLGEAGAIDYAGLHYTCFQFPYDWRRDISEQAAALHELILEARRVSQDATGKERRVDVVAHSMGGLVLRYYLRYGPHPLPEDGSLPPLTWEGAKHVENAVLVGTPSAGSVLSLKQLLEGVNFAALITPTYNPSILGSFPSIYQLLPRNRHARVIDEEGAAIDLLEVETWVRNGWGLADPGEAKHLADLLPHVESAEERCSIALDHLEKSLARARQLFAALDRPAAPPASTSMHLVCGDALETPAVITVAADGSTELTRTAPGDDTVCRTSALMDERTGGPYVPRLRTPVGWSSVLFLPASHIGLTKHPSFSNFVLFLLLEKPEPPPRGPQP